MANAAQPRVLIDCRAEVGEGPTYDPTTHTLFWVDIPRGRLWRHHLASGETSSRDIGEPLGSVALIEGGGLLLAAKRGILVLAHWNATPWLWIPVEPDLPTQFNDGKCDARGRFIAGTAGTEAGVKGTLYRIDHDGTATALVDGIGMSNGIDWSPDERFFYHVDTLAQAVTRYRWDADAGLPFDPITLIDVRSEDGLPDGLSVDAEGCLWLAVWGASEIRRYDHEGRFLGTIDLPTPNVSSCAFGGQALNELYMTTAAAAAPTEGTAGRLAGNVFVATIPMRGQSRSKFPSAGIPAEAFRPA